MKEDDITQGIIELLGQKKEAIREDVNALALLTKSVQSILERYYDNNSTYVKQAVMLSQYTAVLLKTKKDSFPIYPRCSIKEISEDLDSLICSVIQEFQTIGLPETQGGKTGKDITINNTLNQNQSQELNLIINVFLESIKDELNGKQRKEILSVVNEAKSPDEAHKGILAKLKEFGVDVTASIVANILTNPNVWSSIGNIL